MSEESKENSAPESLKVEKLSLTEPESVNSEEQAAPKTDKQKSKNN